MSKKFLVTSIILLSFLASCCAPKETCCKKESLQDSQIRCAIVQANAGETREGPSLTSRKLSLSEISHYLEMDEKNVCDHLGAMGIHGYFSLIAKNFPPGREFILYSISYKGTITPSKTFFVCPDGGLVTPLCESTVNLANNFLVFEKYLPGEPIDLVLGSKCGEYYVATRIVPNPIETVTERNQRLSVQMASPDGKRFQVVGEGLEPFGCYMMASIFDNEKLAYELTANEQGRICQIIGPTIPWVNNGDGAVALQGPGINRAIYLKFTWFALPCDED